MKGADPLALLESLYELESSNEAWLAGLAARARTAFAIPELGAYALSYDASDIGSFHLTGFASSGTSADVSRFVEHDISAFYKERPAIVQAMFRQSAFGRTRELGATQEVSPIRAAMSRWGVHDILGLNGIAADGRSAHIGVLVPDSAVVDADLLARLSTHLAAAFRLRARLQGRDLVDAADATLTSDGSVLEATEEAARADLAKAATRLAALRRTRDTMAVRRWKALVDARWALVDHFSKDGTRYVLAQRNDESTAPLALLTDRERQVVALAALEHPNEIIAYELGIAVSTVGVLLGRAAKKLGTRSRRELIELYLRYPRTATPE